eukprot:gene12567-16853_t
MLAARRLPEILQGILNDGIDGACLMTVEGSLLSSAFVSSEQLNGKSLTDNEITLAAVASTVWENYSNQGSAEVLLYITQLDEGYLGITVAGKGYLVAAYGRKVNIGLLKGRLQALNQYFSQVFEQIS